MTRPADRPRLALFDLDHTLLLGDSDALWCEFLMDQGLLDRGAFAVRNAEMQAGYQAGTVSAQAFAGFYLATLAGRSAARWEPLRRRFLHERVLPRIPPGATELVRDELAKAALVVMTTATSRFLTELTAAHFGIAHLLATEAQLEQGRFTGALAGEPNMREGKVRRLQGWLAGRGTGLGDWHSAAYSDSVNDLPLLQAVDEPVAVNADDPLERIAVEHGWRRIRWA